MLYLIFRGGGGCGFGGLVVVVGAVGAAELGRAIFSIVYLWLLPNT
jgi:hypothetical protein